VIPHPTAPPPVVIATFGGKVFGLDPATGRPLWERDMGGPTARLIVTATHIFVAGYGLACLAYPSGEIVWQQPQQITLPTSSFILSEGRLFTGYGGEVACYAAHDGRPLWKNGFPGKGAADVALGTPFNTSQADHSR
jgi:outer membrane protein assembly factor BamB